MQPRKRRKSERPGELLAAALALFVERGFAATRMDDVAARAGVSKGALYLYFAGKEELLSEVIVEHVSNVIGAMADRLERCDGPTAALLGEMLASWWQQVVDTAASGLFKVILVEACSSADIAALCRRQIVEPTEALCRGLLRRGVRRGELADVDVDSIAHLMAFQLMTACLHQHTVGACLPHARRADLRAFVADHLALLLKRPS
jgi:AcrR family transcriptional regulator